MVVVYSNINIINLYIHPFTNKTATSMKWITAVIAEGDDCMDNLKFSQHTSHILLQPKSCNIKEQKSKIKSRKTNLFRTKLMISVP